MKHELIGAAIGVAVFVASVAVTREQPRAALVTGRIADKTPKLELSLLRYEFPKNERLQFLKMELRLRSRCDAEEGVFLWSGTEDQPMRCWSDVCVRREEGCIGTDIIWEVDPEKDDFYRSGGY